LITQLCCCHRQGSGMLPYAPKGGCERRPLRRHRRHSVTAAAV